MFNRPIIIPLIVFIAVIIIADLFIPTVFLRNHYIKHLSKTTTFQYLIIEKSKESPKNFSYIATIIAYKDPVTNKWEKTSGKIKIFIPKINRQGYKNQSLNYGDVIVCSDNMRRIRNFTQLNSFDYSRYMRHKRIYHQVFIRNFDLIATKQGNPIINIAQHTNLWLKRRLQQTDMRPEQQHIAIALLLGDKTDLEGEIRTKFNTSGLAHILCVSGLHIILIVSALAMLLKLILPPNIGMIYLRNGITILLCWAIAFIVGLTPSALRVATMLSLLIISKFTSLNNDKINLLLVTAFIFLCFDPLLLFNISFQLSFLAVLGLVSTKIWLYNLIKNKLNITKSILQRLLSNAVSTTTAQIFTLPIIVINFKQLPILFLISNLIVIPLMQIILISLILLLVFQDIPLLNTALCWLCDTEMSFLMQLTNLIEKLTSLIIK